LEEQAEIILEVKKDLMTVSKDNTANKEEVSSLLVDKIKEVEQDIAMKMRLIFGKMQEDLRKELTNYANREFVPTSFLDDLDKQLNELDDRIANI
jgi:DNA-binding transcriptional MerR regulator